MYSLVLATMLTAGGTDAANFGHHGWGCCCGGGWGCHGCCGGWGYGCCGGWGCHGCCGGWGYGCCGGCCGGWSYGGYGCCGGYYGCCGGCWGGYSCCGGYGCYGGYGCCGGYGGIIYTSPGDGYAAPGGNQVPPPSTAPAPKPDDKIGQGTVVVRLPQDAKLYVDGQAMNLTSSPRTFVTPRLAQGKQYFYNVKAEWAQDGKTVSDSKRVLVRAGKVSTVEFGDTADVSKDEAPAQVTVHLPGNAKLYVDGQLFNLKSDVRTFSTPPLVSGKRYYYILKTEVVRDGTTKSDSRKVILEAGKKVEVNFDRAAVAQAND